MRKTHCCALEKADEWSLGEAELEAFLLSQSASSVGNSYLQTGHQLCCLSHSVMQLLSQMWPQGIRVPFSLRSSQQIAQRGYSVSPVCSFFLQYLSVITISGSFSMESQEAGGVPCLPLSRSESLRMCWRISSPNPDLKFIMKLSLKVPSETPFEMLITGKNIVGEVLQMIILGLLA